MPHVLAAQSNQLALGGREVAQRLEVEHATIRIGPDRVAAPVLEVGLAGLGVFGEPVAGSGAACPRVERNQSVERGGQWCRRPLARSDAFARNHCHHPPHPPQKDTEPCHDSQAVLRPCRRALVRLWAGLSRSSMRRLQIDDDQLGPTKEAEPRGELAFHADTARDDEPPAVRKRLAAGRPRPRHL